MPAVPKLKALVASAQHNVGAYAHDKINTALLERFRCPWVPRTPLSQNMWEHIHVPEFTCLCPITGQPDFAHIDVYYAPNEWCVESKSIKLYLGSFRNVGTFHEACAARVHDDLDTLLAPKWMLVVGRFTPRGGIPFQPRVWTGDVPRELLYLP